MSAERCADGHDFGSLDWEDDGHQAVVCRWCGDVVVRFGALTERDLDVVAQWVAEHLPDTLDALTEGKN